MKVLKLSYPSGSKEDYLKELFVHSEQAFNLQFGTVFLKKGTRIPEQGFTHHDQKKIVFLVEGEIKILLEDDTVDFNKSESGYATLIDDNVVSTNSDGEKELYPRSNVKKYYTEKFDAHKTIWLVIGCSAVFYIVLLGLFGLSVARRKKA